jgi:hypothetical protein
MANLSPHNYGRFLNMAKLTTAALAAHELGLAATFGGILFGQTGLNSTAKAVSNPDERSKVMDQAWKTFAVPKTVGLLTTGATWLVGRSLFSGRFMGRELRRLVIAKDVALGITVGTGLAAHWFGKQLSKEQPFPADADGFPAPSAPERARSLVRTVSILGTVQMLAAGAALALTSALNLRGQRNTAWRAIAHVLP